MPHLDDITLTETKLSLMRDMGTMCDLIVQVNDSTIPNETVNFRVHKLLLVAASPYFYDLFVSDQLENTATLPTFVEPLSFSILLDYIYFQPISLRSIRAKLNHDPAFSSFTLSLTLEKMIGTAMLLGLSQLVLKLTEWLKNPFVDETLVETAERREDSEMLDVKQEVVDVKCLPAIEENGAELSLPGSEPVQGEIIDLKDDLNSLELFVAKSDLRVSLERVDGRRRQRRTEEEDDEWVPTCDNDLGIDEEKKRKSRKKRNNLAANLKLKARRKVRSAVQRKKQLKINGERKRPREVRSFDLIDPDLNIKNYDPNSDGENGDDDSQSSSTARLNPENGQLEGGTENVASTDFDQGMDLSTETSDPTKPDNPRFKILSANDLQKLFKNPRDFQQVKKRRILANVDRVEGDANSWSYALDVDQSFIGRVIPFGNSQAKVWEDGKKIRGEIRGENIKTGLRLILEDGSVQTNIKTRKVGGQNLCPFCENVTDKFNRFKFGSHFLNHHGYLWIEMALVCNLCTFVTIHGKSLRDHLHRFHGVLKTVVERTLFPCRRCGKEFRFQEGRKSHEKMCLAIKGGEKRAQNGGICRKMTRKQESSHVCSICGKSFAHYPSLENHMCAEHGKPKRYNCIQEGCTFGTNQKDPFFDHLFSAHKISTGAKPVLQCQHCDYSSIRKHTFERHQLIHTEGERNLICKYDGCEKAFREEKQRKTHYRVCHVDLSLRCQYCPSIFRTPAKLRAHERVMHTHRVRNFKCAYCNHTTVQRTNCRTHIKNSHKGMPVTVINLEKIGLTPVPEPPLNRF